MENNSEHNLSAEATDHLFRRQNAFPNLAEWRKSVNSGQTTVHDGHEKRTNFRANRFTIFLYWKIYKELLNRPDHRALAYVELSYGPKFPSCKSNGKERKVSHVYNAYT